MDNQCLFVHYFFIFDPWYSTHLVLDQAQLTLQLSFSFSDPPHRFLSAMSPTTAVLLAFGHHPLRGDTLEFKINLHYG